MTDETSESNPIDALIHAYLKTSTLYVTDAEMLRRLGIPENLGYRIIHELDKNPSSGFPAKSELWGDRRYWPAIKKWHDITNRVIVDERVSLRRVS